MAGAGDADRGDHVPAGETAEWILPLLQSIAGEFERRPEQQSGEQQGDDRGDDEEPPRGTTPPPSGGAHYQTHDTGNLGDRSQGNNEERRPPGDEGHAPAS